MLHTNQNSFNKWTKIMSLEIDIIDLKMMVKSGLEFFILKFTEPLQSCCCPVQKNLPRKAELAWQAIQQISLNFREFQNKNSRPLFTIIFKSKMVISRLEILVHLLKVFQLVCMQGRCLCMIKLETRVQYRNKIYQ